MKQHLNPGVNVTSIEGYKVVVRLQASETDISTETGIRLH